MVMMADGAEVQRMVLVLLLLHVLLLAVGV